MQALGAIPALPGKTKTVDRYYLYMPSAIWVYPLFYVYHLSLTEYCYVAYDCNCKLAFISKA